MEKPGYKTTEFWLSLGVVLLGALAAAGLVGPDHWLSRVVGLLIDGLAILGYNSGRARVKFGEAQKAALISNGGSAVKRPSKRGS